MTIHIGNGLQFDQKGNLTIKPHTGILVDSDGVSVRVGSGLEIDPSENIKNSDDLQKEISGKAEKSSVPKPEDWAGDGLEAKENKLSIVEPEKRFTIIYPNGGTEETPAALKTFTRYIMDNPFPNHMVECRVEALYKGEWGAIPWAYFKDPTTRGASAYQLNDDKIVIQAALHALGSTQWHGNPFGNTENIIELPCRVKVWRID